MGRADTPRHLGMSFIAVGTLAMLAAVWQHENFLKDIGASRIRRRLPISVVVAVVVILIGVLTFFGVWMRTGPF
jgi:putative membrane protein